MVVFPCHVCKTSLSADDPQAGQLVRCPTCFTTLRVPAAQAAPSSAAFAGVGASAGGGIGGSSGSTTFQPPAPAGAGFGSSIPRTGGKRYGFNCGYCSSRLEATEAMAA